MLIWYAVEYSIYLLVKETRTSLILNLYLDKLRNTYKTVACTLLQVPAASVERSESCLYLKLHLLII